MRKRLKRKQELGSGYKLEARPKGIIMNVERKQKRGRGYNYVAKIQLGLQ